MLDVLKNCVSFFFKFVVSFYYLLVFTVFLFLFLCFKGYSFLFLKTFVLFHFFVGLLHLVEDYAFNPLLVLLYKLLIFLSMYIYSIFFFNFLN